MITGGDGLVIWLGRGSEWDVSWSLSGENIGYMFILGGKSSLKECLILVVIVKGLAA